MYQSESVPLSFLEQIDGLIDERFDRIRLTRGDGDSLYRSVGLGFIEQVLQAPDPRSEVVRAISTLTSTRTLLETAGFQPPVFEDLLNIMVSIIQQIVTPDLDGEKMTPEVLLEAFQLTEVSNSVVLYLRLLTSAQIRADPDSYIPFLIDFQMDPIEFCKTCVEHLGVDADDIQVAALSRALGIAITLGRLEGQKLGSRGVEFVTYENTRRSGNAPPILLLRRPGHFELLYSS